MQLPYFACEHTPSVSHFFGLVCEYMYFAVKMADTVVFCLFFREREVVEQWTEESNVFYKYF